MAIEADELSSVAQPCPTLRDPMDCSYRTPYQSLLGERSHQTWVRHTGFQGRSQPLCPLLPGKAIKLFFFYFTQNSVSEILFGTHRQRAKLSASPLSALGELPRAPSPSLQRVMMSSALFHRLDLICLVQVYVLSI